MDVVAVAEGIVANEARRVALLDRILDCVANPDGSWPDRLGGTPA